MTTIDCLHQVPAERTCKGCKSDPGDDSGTVSCEGEIEGSVSADSDGDAGVINGIRHFLAVEDVTPTCGCELTQAEIDKACEKLAELAVDDYDEGPDPDDAYDRSRED